MYIFDIRNYKISFFHAKICFDNNLYFNKFIYVLFLQNLNNFVSFKTPVMERWFIHMKIPVTAPALLVLSRVLFIIESMAAQRWQGRLPGCHRYDSISTTIYIYIYFWAYICKTI